MFGGYAITTIEFDADRTAWIRLDNKHRDDIPSLERELRLSVLGGRILKELVSFRYSRSPLFVGNISEGVDDEALRSMFQRHGKIDRAFVSSSIAIVIDLEIIFAGPNVLGEETRAALLWENTWCSRL